MAILKKRIYLSIITMFFCCCLFADQAMILIDKSGSMRGFHSTGQLEKIYQGLYSALNESGHYSNINLFAFDTKGLVKYNRFKEIGYYGDTLIDVAINDAFKRKPQLIVTITDNIQDPGGKDPESDVTKFYNLLKEEVVEWVFIFPLKLKFNGWTYHDPQWEGDRAAIMYAILLKKEELSHEAAAKRERAFLNTVESIKKAVESRQIRCKPLETGVKMNFKKIKKVNRNINITPKEINISFKEFTSTPRFGLKLVVASKYSNIAVNRGKLEGAAVGRIKTEGLLEDIRGNDFNVTIEPGEADIPPGVSDDRYRVTMNTTKLAYKNDLPSLLKMPFKKNGKVSGELKIKIRIPKRNLQLLPDILEKYSTDNRDDPSRIFGLDQLVPALAEGEEVVINKKIKFNITMAYPWWPALLLCLFLLLTAVLVFVALRLFKGSSNRYILKCNGDEQGEVRFFPFLWTLLYANAYGSICKARFKGDTTEVLTLPGYNWNDGEAPPPLSRIFPRGDSFTLFNDENESFFIELNPVDRKKYEDEEEEYDDEDNSFFED